MFIFKRQYEYFLGAVAQRNVPALETRTTQRSIVQPSGRKHASTETESNLGCSPDCMITALISIRAGENPACTKILFIKFIRTNKNEITEIKKNSIG